MLSYTAFGQLVATSAALNLSDISVLCFTTHNVLDYVKVISPVTLIS